jgi:hypothetical protein
VKNQKFPSWRHLGAILTAAVFLGATHAAAVLDPITGVTASSSDTAAGDPNFTATNASLKAGGSGTLGASDSLADTGIESNGSTRFGDWLTSPPTGGVITYNLGADYNVVDLLVWSYNQDGFTAVGPQTVDIYTSLTGLAGSFSLVPQVVTFSQVTKTAPTGTATQDSGDPNDGYETPAQIIPVNLPDAKYVKLDLTDNYGNGTYTGFNEVNFVAPEPSTFAMLGLGLLGLVAWQRKRAAFNN